MAKSMSLFHDLADTLAGREKLRIEILFRNKRTREDETIEGVYDGTFGTVQFMTRMGGATVPARELRTWLKMFFSADPGSVRIMEVGNGKSQ